MIACSLVPTPAIASLNFWASAVGLKLAAGVKVGISAYSISE